MWEVRSDGQARSASTAPEDGMSKVGLDRMGQQVVR